MNLTQDAHSEDDNLERAVEEEMQRMRMESLAWAPRYGHVTHDERGRTAGKDWVRDRLLAGKKALENLARRMLRAAAALDGLAAALQSKKAMSS